MIGYKDSSIRNLPLPPAGKSGWPWKDKRPQLPETMPGGLDWPKTSVVAFSYNQGQFIEEAIRAALLPGRPERRPLEK